MHCFQQLKNTNNNKISTEFFWKKPNIEKGFLLIVWDKGCMLKKTNRV